MTQINFKRGTDTARTDGTLGTPSQGEPIYTTDTKALFVGDGSTSGGVPVTRPGSLLHLGSTLTTNINATATINKVGWDVQHHLWGVDITHDTASRNTRVTIATTGLYEISATVAVNALTSSAVRYNGFLRCRLNDTTDFGPVSCCAYIRDTTAHDNASFHLSTFVYQLTAGDYFELKIDRETSVTAAVNLTPNYSSLYVKRLG